MAYALHRTDVCLPVAIRLRSALLLHFDLDFLTVTDRTEIHNGALMSLCTVHTLRAINRVYLHTLLYDISQLQRCDEVCHILSVRLFICCQQC